MIRPLIALAVLIAATPAIAQRVSPAVQQRLAELGAQLGQCHRGAAVRMARTRLNADQVADRALAACAPREAPIRQTLARAVGAGRAQSTLMAQRRHWRQTIVTIVQQARFTRR